MYTGQRTIHLWTQDKGPSTFSRGQSSRRVLHPRTTSLNKGLKEGGRRQSISGTLAGKDKRRKELPLSQDDLPHLQEGQGQGRQGVHLTRPRQEEGTHLPSLYKYKYKDKTKSILESCIRSSVDKDKKDKVSILQGQDRTRSVPEPWTQVRRKVHTYLPW